MSNSLLLKFIVLFLRSSTHRNRSSCPARNASCRFCGKRGHFARVYRSKGLSTDVPSVVFAAQSISRPFLASAPSTSYLGRWITPLYRFSRWLWRVWFHWPRCLRSTEPTCDWTEVFNRYGFVRNRCWNPRKDYGRFKTPRPNLPASNFRVLKNLCSDVVVGQTFLKLHSSVTFVMNGQKALTIAASSKLSNAATQLSLLPIWSLRVYLSSFFQTANQLLLPRDVITLKIRYLSNLKCSDCWVRISLNLPGPLGERKFLLWNKVKRKGCS